MSPASVVSWSLVSGYKTFLGATRDPSCSPASKGSTEAKNATMKHLQKLLLSLLLVTYPPAIANYFWNRIEGGAEAKAHSRPYMAYLQGKNNHFCGGFLVAPNWVMTAAQCFNHKPLTVILGAHNIQKKEESWQTFEVQKYYRHPDFTVPQKGNDILLLKLKGNATSNNYVKTISFQKQKALGGTVCSIAGWGHGMPAAMLHEASVTILKPRDCLNLYPGLANNLICARSGYPGALEKGDIGSPLICNNKAYGIFSYGYGNWPGFYTYIAAYLPWIDSVMKSA
ncbi:trypsin-2-like isoform X2 [Apteryx rowi]|uniref:trypsin-2-like isoform X2 n=1 Tax=Apteryx rowi TaxID=308060 RepID=UPI000E1DEF0C|nr:trypsin-2-like isoform X2 [Apteryx rowi]